MSAPEQRATYADMALAPRPILGFALGIAGVIVVVLGLMALVFGGLAERSAAEQTEPHPLAGDVQVPPEPRLLEDPDAYFQAYTTEQRDELTKYEWIDRDAGVVRLPVERAMEIALEEGFPVR